MAVALVGSVALGAAVTLLLTGAAAVVAHRVWGPCVEDEDMPQRSESRPPEPGGVEGDVRPGVVPTALHRAAPLRAAHGAARTRARGVSPGPRWRRMPFARPMHYRG